MTVSTSQTCAVKLKGLKKAYLIFAFGFGFSGFQLLLLVLHGTGFGYASRIITVPYRMGFLAFSLVLILYGISARSFSRLGALWIPFLIFWFLYFLRITMDGYLFHVPLGHPPIEYVQKSVGVVFIPCFLFLMRLGYRENALALKAFWTVHIVCLVFALVSYQDFIGMSYRSLRYSSIDASTLMSSINLSYIGAVAAVVSFQLLLMEFTYLKRTGRLLFLSVTLFGGMVVTIFGSTRSALIAWVFTSVVIIFKSGSKRHKVRQALIVAGSVLAIGIVSYALMEKIGSGMVGRYKTLGRQIAVGDPDAGSGRLTIYRNVFEQILQEPLLGSGLEERHSRTYPHNHVLEAFMATGFIGGVCFVILCWTALKKSFLILHKYKTYGWIACYFLVIFMRGFFSSSIIDPDLWYSMVAIHSVPTHKKG